MDQLSLAVRLEVAEISLGADPHCPISIHRQGPDR